MCGSNGVNQTTQALPAKGSPPVPDAAPAKGGGAVAGAAGGPAAAVPTGFGSVLDQITNIEKSLESLVAALQGNAAGGGPKGGPPVDPAPGKGPGQVGGMSGCPMMDGPSSPVQQIGGGGPTGAVQGLASFVRDGQATLTNMQQKADQNARANGGSYSQIDVVTIRQRTTQVNIAKGVQAFLGKHPTGVNSTVDQLVNQALANSNQDGGNWRATDLANIRLTVLHNEGKASDAAFQGLPGAFAVVQQMGDSIKAMTNKSLANANANGGNFSQVDLAQIDKATQTEEAISNSLADVTDHASKLTATQVQQVQQAVQQAAQSGDAATLQQVVAQVTQGA